MQLRPFEYGNPGPKQTNLRTKVRLRGPTEITSRLAWAIIGASPSIPARQLATGGAGRLKCALGRLLLTWTSRASGLF